MVIDIVDGLVYTNY